MDVDEKEENCWNESFNKQVEMQFCTDEKSDPKGSTNLYFTEKEHGQHGRTRYGTWEDFF